MNDKGPKTYECLMEVRGYELDRYGHVNHANYFSYLEHARWKMLEAENLTHQKFETLNAWPIVVEVQGKYIRPLFVSDPIKIETTPGEHSGTRMKFHQKIFKGDQVVFEATISGTMVNKEGRPVKIPDEIMRLWDQ